MSSALNPVAWLGWSAAATLIVVSTRNPLYLILAGAACGAVYLSRGRRAESETLWWIVLRIGSLVAILSVAFNLATVHAGDYVLTDLPDRLPIVGGPITLNALVYGLTSACALLTLLLIATTLSVEVDHASLLRLVPAQITSIGVAALVALSFLPQTLRAVQDVREAQAARGFRIRSVRDVPPLVIPVLFLGLERAFNLAEAMEGRAFGAMAVSSPVRAYLLLPGLGMMAGSIIAYGLGNSTIAVLLVLPGLTLLGLALLRRRVPPRGRYRALIWQRDDLVVLLAAVAAAGLVVATYGSEPSPLAYSPYPRLHWPPFALAPGISCVLLVAPVLRTRGWSPT